jgi:hypothetical protein
MTNNRKDGLKIGYISDSGKEIISFSDMPWKSYVSKCLSCEKELHSTRKEVERSCSCSRSYGSKKLPIGYKGKERMVIGYNDHRTRIYQVQCLFCQHISMAPREALDTPCKQCFNYRQDRLVPIEDRLFSKWKTSIAKRHTTTLSKEEYLNLIYKDCFYCGEPPKNIYSLSRKYNNSIVYQGIDRINPNLEYDMNNCISCCWTCNRMKADMTVDEFKEKIKNLFTRMEMWNV